MELGALCEWLDGCGCPPHATSTRSACHPLMRACVSGSGPRPARECPCGRRPTSQRARRCPGTRGAGQPSTCRAHEAMHVCSHAHVHMCTYARMHTCTHARTHAHLRGEGAAELPHRVTKLLAVDGAVAVTVPLLPGRGRARSSEIERDRARSSEVERGRARSSEVERGRKARA